MKYAIITGIIGIALVTVIALNVPGLVNGEDIKTTKVQLYKDPDCTCCGQYSEYLDHHTTSDVSVTQQLDMDAIKSTYHIPSSMESCHTTIIDGYTVEGHIPAAAIQKLVEEQPDIIGIAMPGMPSGTPGMNGPKVASWVIYAIHHDGSITEFMRM